VIALDAAGLAALYPADRVSDPASETEHNNGAVKSVPGASS
jgi:hypothetical protein